MADITYVDNYIIKDKYNGSGCGNKNSQLPIIGLRGWVKIFLDNQKVYENSNLVVGIGREFVAQKIFNHVSPSNDFRNYVITHFAVGSDGASLDCSTTPYTVTLNGPHGNDEHLNSAINLEDSGYLSEPGGVAHACKPINSIAYEQVSINGTNYYTDVKCTCIVDVNEPNSSDTIQISEAGLYFVSGSTTRLFAHICFPPKWKEPDSTLTIEWTIRC